MSPGIRAALTGTAAMLCCVVFPSMAVEFTPEEKLFVLAHGPWPAETRPDPGNPYSGKRDAIAFGKALFHERLLSKARVYSCAGCHQTDNHFADGRQTGLGEQQLKRNTIALANLRLRTRFGWDGAHKNLWVQSIRPITRPEEMNMEANWLARRFSETPRLAEPYTAVTGGKPADDMPETVLANIGKILAAWQETLATPRTPFDDFRDALARSDETAMERYPISAKRGLKLFVGAAGCASCHFGPNFAKDESFDIGTGGGKFRVPSLRNVAQTAPYMHDGSKPTLGAVIDHYASVKRDRLPRESGLRLRPVSLSTSQKDDLIAFLNSLNGGVKSQ